MNSRFVLHCSNKSENAWKKNHKFQNRFHRNKYCSFAGTSRETNYSRVPVNSMARPGLADCQEFIAETSNASNLSSRAIFLSLTTNCSVCANTSIPLELRDKRNNKTHAVSSYARTRFSMLWLNDFRERQGVSGREFPIIRTNSHCHWCTDRYALLEEKGRKDGRRMVWRKKWRLNFCRESSRAFPYASIRPSNIINFHDWLVITIIKFPRGPRRALSANFYAASSPLSLAAMVPDTDLQLLLIESNTGRVFRTLNEWRIARPRSTAPRRRKRSFPRRNRALDAWQCSEICLWKPG